MTLKYIFRIFPNTLNMCRIATVDKSQNAHVLTRYFLCRMLITSPFQTTIGLVPRSRVLRTVLGNWFYIIRHSRIFHLWQLWILCFISEESCIFMPLWTVLPKICILAPTVDLCKYYLVNFAIISIRCSRQQVESYSLYSSYHLRWTTILLWVGFTVYEYWNFAE